MPTKPNQTATESQAQAHAQRRALAAVQESLDRRDNGGDAATATDN
jgi:hypothetical protein